MARKIESCMNCSEEREIVAHNLCAMCYMRVRREADDDAWAVPEKHAHEQRKRQQDGRKALVAMLDKLETLEKSGLMPPEDINMIRSKLATQLERAALALKSMTDDAAGKLLVMDPSTKPS